MTTRAIRFVFDWIGRIYEYSRFRLLHGSSDGSRSNDSHPINTRPKWNRPKAIIVESTINANKFEHSTVMSTKRILTACMDSPILVICMLLACTAMIDVYGSIALWCLAAIPASCIGAIIAFVPSSDSVFGWLAKLGIMLFAQFTIGPIVLLHETTLFHVLPTSATLIQGFQSLFTSWKTIIGIPQPVARLGGAPIALWTIMLWMTFLSGSLFARATAVNTYRYTKSEKHNASFKYVFASMMTIWASLVISNLLGTQTNRSVVQGCIGCMIVSVQVLWCNLYRRRMLSMRFPPSRHLSRHDVLQLLRNHWKFSIVTLFIIAFVCPAMIMPLGSRITLRDWYTPPIDLYGRSSPLSGMRSLLKQHADDIVLSVTGLPAGTPIRIAVMDYFDGNIWSFTDDEANAFHPIGASMDGDHSGNPFTATFTIGEGLDDIWLPLAGETYSITLHSNNDGLSMGNNSTGNNSSSEKVPAAASTLLNAYDINMLYNAKTHTGLFVPGLVPGLSYTVSGTIPENPDIAEIADCDGVTMQQSDAQHVPASVGDMASILAGSRSSAGQTAISLAESLSSSGWFSHGIDGDYPSLAGHGSHRVDMLLTGDAMVGDSEQYASAMALMARELGLSSRVVLGFTSDGQTADGNHVEFTGADIQAWVEIQFEHYGWVAFDPTPSETKIPDDAFDLSPPNPQSTIRQPGVPLAERIREETRPNGHSSISGQNAKAPETTNNEQPRPLVLALYAVSIPLGLLFLIVVGLLALNSMLIHVAQRKGTPAQRIAAGWKILTGLAAYCGVDTSGTRRDQTTRIIAYIRSTRNANRKRIQNHMSQQTMRQHHANRLSTHCDETTLTALCAQADKAMFSHEVMSERQAREYWSAVLALRRWILQSIPKPLRWQIRLALQKA